MRWFINRGQRVPEKIPIPIHFMQPYLVSSGQPKSTKIEVQHDPVSIDAPIHKGLTGAALVTLKGDLSLVPKAEFDRMIRVDGDGKRYYWVQGSVEAVFESASTRYTLIIGGEFS
jgi:hypothetical protein